MPIPKHSLSNLKPYEIVIEDRAPVMWLNSPDAPAWFSRIQRRKWKERYHLDDKHNPTTIIAKYVRAGRRNEWMLDW